jgi:hypothetical protein
MKLRVVAAALSTLVVEPGSHGQGIGPGRPIVGSTEGILPKQTQFDYLNPGIKVHKNPVGERCVTVSAYSRPKTNYRKIFGGGSEQGAAAPKTFQHMIVANNRCGQMISINVCYYESQSCVTVQAPGYGEGETILGIASGSPGFRYQYTEQF